MNPETVLREMWRLQEANAKVTDDKWQRHMSPVVRSLKATRASVRTVERRALAFGRRKDVEALTARLNKDMYRLGKVFIQERLKQVEGHKKLPKVRGQVRVDKQSNVRRAMAEVSLTQADQQAIDALTQTHMLWFTDANGAVYLDTQRLRDKAGELIESGEAATTIGSNLRREVEAHYGVLDFAARGRSYWAGVTEHAATTAGVSGQLSAMLEAGVTRYTVVNPMDERTSRVCQVMNGKTLVVEDAVKAQTTLLEADSVEEVKKAKPFVSGGSPADLEAAIGARLREGARALSTDHSEAMAKAGFAVPPYHFRCRSYIDISLEG